MIHTAPSHGTTFDDSVLDIDRIGAVLEVANEIVERDCDDLGADIRFAVASELKRWIVYAELSKLAGGGIPFVDFDDIVTSVAQHVFGVDVTFADAAMNDDELLDIIEGLARDEFRIDTDGTYIA